MDFNIYMPSRLISGSNCVYENRNIFKQYGEKCLIVTSKTGALKSGALHDVTKALENMGIEYLVFDKITENPMVSTVIEGGRNARDFGADFIVGIGGGSPLDASKAVAICAMNSEYDIDGLYNRKVPSKALPVILVGTTSGTGSEVTGVSVLTNDKNMMKKSIGGADCYAAVSFLDAKYTYSMSYNVTVSTALDALAHAVEGWFAPGCNALATAYAKLALPDIYEGLCYLLREKTVPHEKLREKLYLASVYAGLELNICGAAFPHTVGYILTENFGIPHGKACTAFMPYFLKKAKENKPERFSELMNVLGVDELGFINTVQQLTNVKNLGISKEQAEEWCSRFGEVKNFLKTPGGFTKEEAVLLLKEI